jgi:hypothetical protein
MHNAMSNVPVATRERHRKIPSPEDEFRRFQCQVLLTLTACFLFNENLFLSVVTSAGAVLCIKGTTTSVSKRPQFVETQKWLTKFTGISFRASLVAWLFDSGSKLLDSEPSYMDTENLYVLKIFLWLFSRTLQVGWSSVLTLFLILTAAMNFLQ